MGAQPFFKGLSWLLVLNLLIKPAWIFLVDRRVQNIVGHEAYGTYFALYNLTYVALFIADAGLTNMVTQRLAAGHPFNVRQLFGLKIFLLLLYSFVCTGVAILAGVTEWMVLVYLILIQGLTSLFLFLRGLLTARQLFKTDAYFSVLDKSLLLLLCLGPVYGFIRPMTLLLFLQLQTFSLSIATGSLLLLLLKRKGMPYGEKLGLRNIANWVRPFVLIVLLMSAHNRLDAFLLERLHPDGAVQAGIYAMAYRLLDAGNMVGYLTASFLLPFLSRHRTHPWLVQEVVLYSRHGLLFLSAGVVAFVAVFTPWLQQEMYGSNSSFTNTVMALTLFSLPAYYLIQVYGTALTAFASFRLFILLLCCAVVTNVVLNLWLIPLYGAVGSSVAALVSQYSCGLALWTMTSWRLQLSRGTGSLLFYLLAALAVGILLYGAKQLTNNVWLILCSIASLVLLVLVLNRNRLKNSFLPLFK